MQFKPGDRVRRLSAYQNLNGWPWGGEVREVRSIQNGAGIILKDCGTHFDYWMSDYFELDTGPNAAQLAATAKFDGHPQPDAQKTVQLKGDLLAVLLYLRESDTPASLRHIALHTGVSELSVGSRVRDLRKPKFGGYNIERTKAAGSHVYALKDAA